MTVKPFAAGAALVAIMVGLGGCSHFPNFASLTGGRLKVRAVSPEGARPDTGFDAENRLYADSVRAIDKRHYGEALQLLQVARDARPNDPRVLTAMGVVYDDLGRFDLSTRYYALAEKADPGSRIVAQDERYSMFLRSAGKAMADGVAFAKATSKPAPPAPAVTTTDGLYAQAVRAIGHQDYGVAIVELRQARDMSPGDVRVLTALGVTYDHLGRFDLSTRYYAQADKADPGSVVVAEDRRVSLMLQQHGGVIGAEHVVVMASARAPGAALAPPALMHVARADTPAAQRRRTNG